MRKSLRDAIVREAKAAEAILTASESAERELTDVERDAIAAHLSKAAELRKRGENEDELRSQFTGLTDGIKVSDEVLTEDIINAPQAKAASAVKANDNRSRQSIGDQFVKSAQYKDLLSAQPEGRFPEKSRVHSAPFGVKSLITGASDTSAGGLVQNDWRGMIDPFYARPLTVRQLFSAGSTTSDTIEYVKVNTVTNNAAPVAEATESGVIDGVDITPVEGGLKPESGMTFVRDTEPIRTIAHWMPITRRALSDAAQIRSIIDTFLRYGLEEELEDQLMTGDGLGENLTGLTNVSGVQTQAAPVGPATILDTTRQARRKVRIGGRANPTAFVMNPLDWETIELMKDTENRYFGNGPFSMTSPNLWGLPVVESEACPQGTSYVADWRFGMVMDREQATIQVSDSHADWFTRNLIAILAEMRVGFVVFRPQAFVEIAWT